MPRGRPRTNIIINTEPITETPPFTRTYSLGLEAELTTERLKELAGSRSFNAGKEYFNSGLVRNLKISEDTVEATVHGSERYNITLKVKNGELDYECTCPYYEDTESFCKHCVATGLAYEQEIQRGTVPYTVEQAPRPGTKAAKIADLGTWLATQNKDTLIKIITDRAKDDIEWRKQLQLLATSESIP